MAKVHSEISFECPDCDGRGCEKCKNTGRRVFDFNPPKGKRKPQLSQEGENSLEKWLKKALNS